MDRLGSLMLKQGWALQIRQSPRLQHHVTEWEQQMAPGISSRNSDPAEPLPLKLVELIKIALHFGCMNIHPDRASHQVRAMLLVRAFELAEPIPADELAMKRGIS